MHIAHYLEHPFQAPPYPYKPGMYHPYAHHGYYPYPYGHPLYAGSPRAGSPSKQLPEVKELPPKDASIKPVSPTKRAKVARQSTKEQWDGYLTSSTAQGVDPDRKNVVEKRKEYANTLKMNSPIRKSRVE